MRIESSGFIIAPVERMTKILFKKISKNVRQTSFDDKSDKNSLRDHYGIVFVQIEILGERLFDLRSDDHQKNETSLDDYSSLLVNSESWSTLKLFLVTGFKLYQPKNTSSWSRQPVYKKQADRQVWIVLQDLNLDRSKRQALFRALLRQEDGTGLKYNKQVPWQATLFCLKTSYRFGFLSFNPIVPSCPNKCPKKSMFRIWTSDRPV